MDTTSDSIEPPEGARPTTAEEYAQMDPFNKGYTNYWQGAWNPAVRGCPYLPGTKDMKEFEKGQNRAMIAAQDSEE